MDPENTGWCEILQKPQIQECIYYVGAGEKEKKTHKTDTSNE